MKAIVAATGPWGLLILAGSISALVGCGETSSKSPAATAIRGTPLRHRLVEPDLPAAPTETPVKISNLQHLIGLSEEDATAITYAPVVALSDGHRSSCRCEVGNAFPAGQINSLDGAETTVGKHLGQRLTVVMFWNMKFPASVEQLSRMNREIVKRFGDVGVKAICINVGDTVEDVQSLLGQLECDALQLLDTNGAAFAEVATDYLPRTYLLDKSGTVRWFDLEYSRSTRRELRNAVIYNLKQQAEAEAQADNDPLM